MAQKVQVVMTCDLEDGEVPAVETVNFSYDGSAYAFELCERHLEEFHDTMGAWIAEARLADGGRRRRTSTGPAARTPRRAPTPASDSGSIRTWAREHGYEVSERGRIPAEVRSAYEEAN